MAVDALHSAALTAVGQVEEMTAATGHFADEMAAGTERRWEWLDYAQRRASRPLTPSGIGALTNLMKGHRGWARTAVAINGRAAELSARYDELLTQLAGWLNSSRHDEGLLDRAVDIIASESNALEESQLLQQITRAREPRPRYSFQGAEPFNAWAHVAVVWMATHRAGRNQVDAEDRAKSVLAEHCSQVRDLTLLPHDGTVPVRDDDCPHSWADRVLAGLRNRYVAAWIDRLEMALKSLSDTHAAAGHAAADRVLLVSGWPLIGSATARLAFLTQYPTVLDPVHVRGRGWDRSGVSTWVAALHVPDAAAEQAVAIDRSIATVPLPGNVEPVTAAISLLRRCGVVVHPVDVPPRPEPSPLVQAERARIAAALDRSQYGYSRPFHPAAEPTPEIGGPDREWTAWSVQRAFTDHCGLFVPGHDDLKLFALGCRASVLYNPIDVQVRLEVPAGSDPSRAARYWGRIEPITMSPSDTDAGLIDVSAVLHGVTEDLTSVLLEVEPCHDPAPVPWSYVALIQADR
ncbi:hypothetical protein [Nocardia tengchongensis]|uniref:hypothetical protein n=1 Tax=Nocardia tengchongensis TaxID=2055889 RepID=UPI0036C7B370